MVSLECFEDLLTVLDPDRRLHSLAAGRKAASVAKVLPPALRAESIVAATLHDIGYGPPVTGFHPLDGARYLADCGFSRTVCHLVAHHSSSTYEAEERGINLPAYRDYSAGRDDLGPAHALLWWVDLTTGPQGQDMTVEERLDDIAKRHHGDVVARSAERIRSILLEAGQSPIGSIRVPS